MIGFGGLKSTLNKTSGFLSCLRHSVANSQDLVAPAVAVRSDVTSAARPPCLRQLAGIDF